MAAVDENGRTALHYAATINDNGHFFNLLSHLGSNPKAEDNVGQPILSEIKTVYRLNLLVIYSSPR